MHNYQLDEILKDLIYLSKLDKFFKDRGITIDKAEQSDFYSFITKSHEGEIDYYTGKPITSISYTEDMGKINDLVCKYNKLKTVVKYLMEIECL